MKLLSLFMENIRKITLAQVELPESGVVTLNAPNEGGKSTFLKGIIWALKGKTAIDNPDTVVTEGERKGKITLHVGEDQSHPKYEVELIFRKGGPVLKVTAVDGSPLPMTQGQLLKTFMNDVSIDPLKFARADAKTQRETLMKVIKFNLDAEFDILTEGLNGDNAVDLLDEAYNAAYGQRTAIGRDRKQAEQELLSYQGVNEDIEDVDVQEVVRKRNDLQHAKDARNQVAHQLTATMQQLDELQRQVQVLTQQKIELVTKLDTLPTVHDTEIALLDEQLQHAADAEKARTKRNLKAKYTTADKEYERLTERLEAIKAYKTKMVETATMPIPGIGFSEEDGGVTFEGQPLESRGVSRNLKIGAAIAASLNPDIRLVLLDEGSELSDDSIRELAQWATANDMQVIVAREKPVDGSGIVSFTIEDGEVKQNV